MPPRQALTASARKRKEGTGVAPLPSANVSRSAVSGSDISRMASSTIAAKPAFPPSPDALERDQDATLAAREAKGLRTSPRRPQRQKDPVGPSQLIAESQNLLSSPESKDEEFTTDFPRDKTISGPPPPAKNCAWSQHLQEPCPTLAPIKCSKPNCKQMIQGIIRELKLNKLPSGCGILDVKDRWLRANYAAVTGGHDSEMPDGWWLSNERLGKAEKDDTRVPCIYLLAALVHKNNPDVIEDPTLAAAGGTRDQQRDQVAKDRGKDIVASKVASVTVRGELDESMMRTKATLMEQNIELQETEGIEKQLNLMDKFKSSFVNVYGENDAASGQREYDMAVCDLLHELPFMKKHMKKRKAAENEKE
jgi:hypothetical protein